MASSVMTNLRNDVRCTATDASGFFNAVNVAMVKQLKMLSGTDALAKSSAAGVRSNNAS